jgi:hypothetical protein
MKIVAQMLRNLEKSEYGKVEFKAPLVVAAPTYNIIDELKAEGDWDVLQKYSGFEFDDDAPKNTARTEYENILYLERPGCNLCMGNQEKAAKGDTVWRPRPACSRAAWWRTPPTRRASRCWPRRRWSCCPPSSAARRPGGIQGRRRRHRPDHSRRPPTPSARGSPRRPARPSRRAPPPSGTPDTRRAGRSGRGRLRSSASNPRRGVLAPIPEVERCDARTPCPQRATRSGCPWAGS